MIADYHVHTPYCGHAQGKTIDYIESAMRAGISEIGFSDHLGRYYLGKAQKKRYWDWGMRERDIARYFSELLDLRDAYDGRITIRIGLEVDYIEGAEHLLEEIVSHYPFDFLLGSIHCLPAFGWRHVSEYSKTNPAQVYESYFDTVLSAIRSGMFQSLAHLDFIWRYVSWPDAPEELLTQYISDVVKASAGSATAIEVNANGFLWSQINDGREYDLFCILLDFIKKHRPGITLGSDAHTPELVGKAFHPIIGLLKKRGIDTVTLFDQKQQKKAKLG
jgi:histidinol-phosphatase (PHP family)